MILLVTNARDLTTDYVVLELQKRGCAYARLNAEALPSGRVTLGFADAQDWSLVIEGQTIRGGDIRAAYFRRPGAPLIDVGVSDSGERAYCAAEWNALLKSLYERIGEKWLSPPSMIAAAEDKPRQLLLARRLGFAVPEVIVTNDLAAASRFLEGPASIAKPLREALIEGDVEKVIFTNRVARAALRDEPSFAAAPVILQREVVKRADVRATVVGDRVFAALIHSQGTRETEVDWRQGGALDLPYEVVVLPPAIADRCVRMVSAMGLRFGAIDLVQMPDGDYRFLEINPNGQWAWIENRTGLPIASAIVDELERIAA